MLNNKKISIRIVAIVLTLLMAISIFAGCTDKAANEKAEAAQSQAEAANAAAAAAQAAANSAAQAALDLAAQLKAAKDAADAAQAAADSAKKAADAAQSNLNSYVSGVKPAETGKIDDKQYNELTNLINATIIGELSQLKTRYLTVRYLWYTEYNYLKLAKLFDDAFVDIYRATTTDGVKDVISKLTTDIAAINSIMTEAEVIQAQLKALGDIDTNVFTTQEASITKIRTAYSRWLIDYRNYFAANGLDVDKYTTNTTIRNSIDELALKSCSLSANNLRYAESKIATLKDYAKYVSAEAYKAITLATDIWGKTTYGEIKVNSAAIEAAYALYKNFMVANGGDGSPLSHTNTTPARTLTGEQFVKQYVMVLYDNWFAQYKAEAAAFVDTLPAFFMNAGVAGGNFTGLDAAYLGTYAGAAKNANYTYSLNALTQAGTTDPIINNEFNTVAVLNKAQFLAWTYSGSFKGTLSLEDAFLQVDNYVKKAMTEMANLYYKNIALTAIGDSYDVLKGNASTYLTSNDSVYKNFDIAFGNEYITAVNAFKAVSAQPAMKTYDQLKATTNIANLKVLNASTATGDVAVTFNAAALVVVLQSMNDAVKEAGLKFADSKAELADLKAFYDFRVDLGRKLTAYIADFNTSVATRTEINKVLTAAGATNLTSIAATAYNTIATNFRNAIFALSYNSYSAQTYQAKTSDNKPIFYDRAPIGTAGTDSKTNTSNIARNPLMIQVDKLVVAKNAAVVLFGQFADQMLNTTLNLCRTQLNGLLDKSVQLYNTNYAGDATVDILNLKTDIANYVAYAKAIAELSSIGTFEAASVFSLENKAVAHNVTLKSVVDTGYTVEVVKANAEYVLHVKDYFATIDDIYNTGVNSYAVRANAKFAEYISMKDSYSNLEKVRLLAYYKDAAIVALNAFKNDQIVGEYNTTTNTWTKTPIYTYEYYSNRKVMYLSEVEKVNNRLIAAINAITMLDKDVLAAADKYVKAVELVDGVLNLANEEPRTTATDAKKFDDFSFKVAYYRYYATNIDGSTLYNWALYNS